MADERRDDDDSSLDARIRRLEVDAAAGDNEARQELLRALVRAGVRGWAFVWDHPATHLMPASGAIRVDVWARAGASTPRQCLNRNARGAWAIAAVDLEDLFAQLVASQVLARGWLVNVATGKAIMTAYMQDLEPPFPLDVPSGIEGQITDFLEDVMWAPGERRGAVSTGIERVRSVFGIEQAKAIVAQAVAADPASDLAWAWARSVQGGGASSFFFVAVRTPAAVVIGTMAGGAGISPGIVHEHHGHMPRIGTYEVYVSQPMTQGGPCPGCGWNPSVHAAQAALAISRLRTWLAEPGGDKFRLGIVQAAGWAGVQLPPGARP